MAALYQEIAGRVQEMALIMGRTLRTRGTWSQLTIRPTAGGPEAADEDIEVELVINADTGETGCYDYVDNVCIPC